jgi:hypothetical protein
MDNEQIAKTEAVFREVNEAIASAADRLEADEAEFVCECADAECAHRITAGLEEYDRVREEPTRFILKPGHEQPRVERVVRREGDYTIVEKFERTVARIVTQLDPRASAA